MDLNLTMSPSSSEAERGFSQLKLIKTNLRSKLGQSALNHCMGIKMLAPDIKEHDPHPAIHYWNSMSIRARRPYLKDHIKTQVQTLELQTPPITASGDCDVVVTSEDSANSDDVLSIYLFIRHTPSLEIPQAEVSADYDSESDPDYDSGLDEEMVFSNYFIEIVPDHYFFLLSQIHFSVFDITL